MRLADRELDRVGRCGNERFDGCFEVLDSLQKTALVEKSVIHRDVKAATGFRVEQPVKAITLHKPRYPVENRGNWDREDLKIDGKLLIEHVQDLLDYVSVMAYRGRNIEKVLESIEHECKYKPGRVELIQETDPKAVEEGVPLHVGTQSRMDEIFAAARSKFGAALPLAVHHYATWRELPK